MAATKYTLKQQTELAYRDEDTGIVRTMTLNAGDEVWHDSRETDTETIHTIWFDDGWDRFTAERRVPKQPAVVVPPAAVAPALVTSAVEQRRIVSYRSNAGRIAHYVAIGNPTNRGMLEIAPAYYLGNSFMVPWSRLTSVQPYETGWTAPETEGESIQESPVQEESIPQTESVPVIVETGESVTEHAVETTAKTAHQAITALATRQESALDDEENRVRRLARAAEMLTGDVFQVNYYIPTSLDVDNPSRIFRRHGFRLDGSNWVFPAKGLESKAVQNVLKEWDSMTPKEEEGALPGFAQTIRVRYWVIKYTREQLAEMRDLARSQLADELQKTHRSLIERIDSAAKALDEAMAELPEEATAKDRDELMNANNGRLRATVKEACERFEMCLKGAEIFDDTNSLDALFGAVRESIRVQAMAVNTTLTARKVKTVKLPTTIA